MTGKNLEIISQIVLWYEDSFRIDWKHLNVFMKLFPLQARGRSPSLRWRIISYLPARGTHVLTNYLLAARDTQTTSYLPARGTHVLTSHPLAARDTQTTSYPPVKDTRVLAACSPPLPSITMTVINTEVGQRYCNTLPEIVKDCCFFTFAEFLLF